MKYFTMLVAVALSTFRCAILSKENLVYFDTTSQRRLCGNQVWQNKIPIKSSNEDIVVTAIAENVVDIVGPIIPIFPLFKGSISVLVRGKIGEEQLNKWFLADGEQKVYPKFINQIEDNGEILFDVTFDGSKLNSEKNVKLNLTTNEIPSKLDLKIKERWNFWYLVSNYDERKSDVCLGEAYK
ncbi:MAG: hypothetical protein K2Q26_08905 [Bdellovibrionales bacterium]|nr:hypothetical protein [Bdellovibrionales bacterium]